jgi:hypothetical protein
MIAHKKALERVRVELEESSLGTDSKILAEQQLDSAVSVLTATNGDQMTRLCLLTAANTAALVSHIVVSADQAAKAEAAALDQAAKVKAALEAAELKLSNHIDQPFSRVGSEAAPVIEGAGKFASALTIIHALTPGRLFGIAGICFAPFSGKVFTALATMYTRGG